MMCCDVLWLFCFFFFSSRRRHTRLVRDWSSDVCSSDLIYPKANLAEINKVLEETTESLVRNLYIPLTLTNLLITIQELLKGKIPITVV